MSRRSLGRAFWLILRAGIAAAVVLWLLRQAGPATIVDAIRQADLLLLSSALAVLLGYALAKALTWLQLLRALGVRGSHEVRAVLECYFAGGLLGTVLPSTAGTDAVRAVLVQRRFKAEFAACIASVVVLNAVSWVAACSLGLVAVASFVAMEGISALALAIGLLFASVIGGAVSVYALLKYRRDWWLRILRLTPRRLLSVRRGLRRFSHHLLLFERAHVRFGLFFFPTVIIQGAYALMIGLAGLAVDIRVPFQVWPIYQPLLATAQLIPASISGFGADQAASVYFLGWVGVPAALAFAASVLVSVLNMIVNVVCGGIAFIFLSSRDRSVVPRAEAG